MSSAAGTPSDCGGDRPWQSYHTAYTNAKAEMEGVDKEKVQKMIYEMSKGSKYFENEQKKEAITKLKIKHLGAQCAKLTDNDISHVQKHLQVLQPGSSLSPTHTTWEHELWRQHKEQAREAQGSCY
ncbi:unnamed protein product [Triticum turgidum subsp. durum]|uniref:Uncharacterized protein n=1 Tax=Triticum turgidum subsp. durum TaxID=4567 RepID=A0A9R0WHS1_TRITD|nr:unnamed protein product [Triticum turgidum subsp. durum]